MENRIKERLTGALILVAAFVVLVPELLSGRAPRQGGEAVPAARPATEGPPLRTYTLDIAAPADATPAGQSALNVKPADATAPLPAPVTEAAPVPLPHAAAATPPPVASKPEPTPNPTPVTAPARRAAAQAPAAAPAPVVSGPSLQAQPVPAVPRAALGNTPAVTPAKGWTVQVGSFAKRENARHYAQQLGQKGYSAQVLGGGTLFRVRVGPVADRAAAAALQSRLAGDGFKGSLAAP